jgi:type I restriction enzyme S subunit
MHYSIPVVQETGTGAVENGEDIASAKQLIQEPVVLISRLNPRKATICQATPHAELLTVASTEFVALRPLSGSIRFLEYLMSSELFRQRLDSRVQSVTRSHQRARPEEVYRFWNAWPDAIEQRGITDFLDRKTAEIDSLVAKKRTLIERLKEKRTATITRAVTRGLPPDVARASGLAPRPKLKPTGIDWLGDIPEHWKVTKGRFLGILLGSTAVDEDELGQEPNGIPYAKVDDLNYVDSSMLLVSTKLRIAGISVLHKPMLLFPKRGAAIFTNKVVIVVGPCLFDSNLMGWQIFRHADLKFIAYCLVARRLDDLADVSTVPQINNKHIYPAHFPEPPLSEQRAIAHYLDRRIAQLDGMVNKIETAIERLQEYRTALITAAVTGKIDVRGAME